MQLFLQDRDSKQILLVQYRGDGPDNGKYGGIKFDLAQGEDGPEAATRTIKEQFGEVTITSAPEHRTDSDGAPVYLAQIEDLARAVGHPAKGRLFSPNADLSRETVLPVMRWLLPFLFFGGSK